MEFTVILDPSSDSPLMQVSAFIVDIGKNVLPPLGSRSTDQFEVYRSSGGAQGMQFLRAATKEYRDLRSSIPSLLVNGGNGDGDVFRMLTVVAHLARCSGLWWCRHEVVAVIH